MVKDVYKIHALAGLKGLWRIDCVLGISDNFANSKSKPIAKVLCSLIDEDFSDNPFADSAALGESKVVSIHLNMLMSVTIGSCWKNGEKFSSHPKLAQRFSVNTRPQGQQKSICSFVVPKEKMAKSGLPRLPLEAVMPNLTNGVNFTRGSANQAAKVGAVYIAVKIEEAPDFDFMVLPASELYRFYFGVSSRFMNAIWMDQLEQYCVWEDGMLRIHKELRRLETFVACRAFASEQGQLWKRFPVDCRMRFSNQIMLDSIPKGSLPPLRARFPFWGQTDLEVCGIERSYIREDGSESKYVYAVELRYCTNDDVPDVTVAYTGFTSTPGPDGDVPKPLYDSSESDESDEDELDDFEESDDLTDDDVANAGTRGAVFTVHVNKFKAADNFKRSFLDVPGGPLTYEVPEGVVKFEEDAYFPAERPDDGEGVTEAEDHTTSIERKLEDFIQMIKALSTLLKSKDKPIRVTTRVLKDKLTIDGVEVTGFPYFETKGGKEGSRRTWHLVKKDKTDNNPRTRHVIWVELRSLTGKYLYLVERELVNNEKRCSTLFIQPKNFERMSDVDFRDMLRMTTIKNSWAYSSQKWAKDKAGYHEIGVNYFERFDHDSFSHPSVIHESNRPKDFAVEWADAVSQKLVQKFRNG